MNSLDPKASKRLWLFLLWLLGSSLVFYLPLRAWLTLSLSNDDASHLPIVPILAAVVIFLERDEIFGKLSMDWQLPAALLVVSLISCVIVTRLGRSWPATDRLSLFLFALVLIWIAGFFLCFGRTAAGKARFPLLLLLLMIPFPTFVLDRVIYFLQWGSAEIAAILFDLSGVPVLRQGFIFHFARVSIEVARECSGIRSSLALIILALLVVHFQLRTTWRKVVFILAGILVMVLKNGVRIVTLTLLASYVDPGFLYGKLHREGGVVFFVFGLLVLAPLLWLLQRNEDKSSAPAQV
ncbi:MAG TPA: exosortase/archaeosortase family protein [Dongiaceae bacterium]|nr:exosortase/archaeosortase family protein [Dongiaceae bacterium]